jgi:hypothetical protein
VQTADQGREDVGILQMKVVAGAIDIGGHDRDEARAVLAIVGLAQLQPGNLGDRVRFVGRLERPVEQGLFPHRLRRELRVDARGAEEQQALDPVVPGLVNDIVLNHQVVMHEFRRVAAVGVNAPDPGRGKKDIVRAPLCKKSRNLSLVGQIELSAPGDEQVRVSSGT